MLFVHTIDKVLDQSKTQTRRIVKAGDVYLENTRTGQCGVFQDDIKVSDRPKYIIGKTYAAQPARGKPAVARIRITDIRREDVRAISVEDVWQEGFLSKFEFMQTWVAMHDKPVLRYPDWKLSSLSGRPAERYDAWALTFELVQA